MDRADNCFHGHFRHHGFIVSGISGQAQRRIVAEKRREDEERVTLVLRIALFLVV